MKGENVENGQSVPKGAAPRALKVGAVGLCVGLILSCQLPTSEESYYAANDADGYRIGL